MVNNPYAVEELTHQHQSELEREAAHDTFARSVHAAREQRRYRSLLARMIAALRDRHLRIAWAGHHGPARSLRLARPHLPHRHAHAAR